MNYLSPVLVIILVHLFSFSPSTSVPAEAASPGEALFQQHCAVCHPGGGNTVNPEYPLKKSSMESHGVKTAGDIVNAMRNPGPGMPPLPKQAISDKDAKKIANYILKTFK